MIYGSITLICIAAWASPGPNMLAILDATSNRGFKAGLLTGLGMALATFFWTLLAAWGSAEIFDTWPQLTFTLRVIGSCYLLYLAWGALQRSTARSLPDQETPQRKKHLMSFALRGFLVSATNPKAAAFFGSILSAFLPEQASSETIIAIALYCTILSALLHATTALICSATATRSIEIKSPFFQRAIALIYTMVAIWGFTAAVSERPS